MIKTCFIVLLVFSLIAVVTNFFLIFRNKKFEMQDIYSALREVENLVIVDDVKNNKYPMPINATGTDEVYIGRIRRDFSVENGINLWDVADNIRKGAASNAIQIAEKLFDIR